MKENLCAAVMVWMVIVPASVWGLEAQPILKQGACPPGYSTSGTYCMPGKDAKFAMAKVGSCPAGYFSSGDYCVAGNGAKQAIPKVGSCPAGYSTNGNYCLSNK